MYCRWHTITMKLTKYLICTVLLVVCIQNTEAKNLERPEEQNLCRSNALAKAELRGIRDVWGKVKEGALVTWNYIKSVGEFTKNQIKRIVGNLKQYAVDLKNKFEVRLEELKGRFNNMISDIYGTGDLVKQCMTKEKDHMEDILKELIADMGQCIAEEIRQLNSVFKTELAPAMNETMFLRYLDAKQELCENNKEDVQECLSRVREEIFDNFTDMENKLLQNNFEARSITDDIKGTLINCSISNLIEATNLISSEVVEIAQCVIEAKGNEGPVETPIF